MHYYVYVLLSLKDHRFYVGFTGDLRNRLSEHAKGMVRSTKDRRPIKLIHYEYFIEKFDAKAREVFFKSGFGRNQLKEALKKTLDKWQYQPGSYQVLKKDLMQPEVLAGMFGATNRNSADYAFKTAEDMRRILNEREIYFAVVDEDPFMCIYVGDKDVSKIIPVQEKIGIRPSTRESGC